MLIREECNGLANTHASLLSGSYTFCDSAAGLQAAMRDHSWYNESLYDDIMAEFQPLTKQDILVISYGGWYERFQWDSAQVLSPCALALTSFQNLRGLLTQVFSGIEPAPDLVLPSVVTSDSAKERGSLSQYVWKPLLVLSACPFIRQSRRSCISVHHISSPMSRIFALTPRGMELCCDHVGSSDKLSSRTQCMCPKNAGVH